MSEDIEYDTCSVCKAEGPVERKYYYYDIECECCNNAKDDHFEIVYYCNECKPIPPNKVICTIKPIPEEEL